MVVAAVGAVAALYYAACSLLLHYSFHSNGWDLGLIHQVAWNTGEGRWFAYSFRDMSYSGDHWQPVVVLLAPLGWVGERVGGGPTPLLLAQALALGGAVVPLYAAARALAGERVAWGAVTAYVLSLGVARAVAFDFHTEAFAPLLAFGALWALAAGRRPWFAAAVVGALLLREDGVLLALALCWVAWLAFGWRRAPAALAAASLGYAGWVWLWLIPRYRGDEPNPFVERYGYLGDGVGEVVLHLVTRPGLAFEQLAQRGPLEALALVLLSGALLPLLAPRLLPALALVVAPSLLSQHGPQGALQLHYMVVPQAVAIVLAVVALRGPGGWVWRRGAAVGVAWVGVALVVFAARSPLPPSFAAEPGRFAVDAHARVARSFVGAVPAGATVSAQSPFVAHLAARERIYQFPRVLDAAYVLLDAYGPIPRDDLDAGYEACRAALPWLGFELVREEDGITLWRRAREAERVREVEVWCSGQRD